MNATEPKKKPEQPGGSTASRRAIAASELLGGAPSGVIEHRGERYELRLTRNGKLILTK
jgi:hemin uptake protein HemP